MNPFNQLINMNRLKPPNSLGLEGNLLQIWKTWKQNFTLFMTVTECNDKSDEVETSLCSSTEDSMKYNKVLEHFEGFFRPRKNITYSEIINKCKFCWYSH